MISTRNVVLSAASLAAVASALTVATPASVVQCQPVALSWGQGTAPYYVAIIPGGQPSAAALESFPTQSGETLTWMVDLAAGQEITVKVTDSTGAINYSDKVPIQAGTETSCSSGNSSSGGSTSGSSAAAVSNAAAGTSAAASSSATLAIARNRSTSTGAAAATTAASSISAIGANAAAATTSPASTGAATSVTAGLGLLGAGLIFALAA